MLEIVGMNLAKEKFMSKFVSFLITIYIISILAWSGLVRAEAVILDGASFNSTNLMLVLEGKSNSACVISIQTEVLEDQTSNKKTNVLIEVVKNQNVDVCFTLESPKIFSKIVDVRSLGLKPGNYDLSLKNIISNKNINVNYSVSIPLNSNYPNYEPVELSGLLSQSESGEWLVTSEQGNITTLKSEIDLSRYSGHRVFVEGAEILHRMGPRLEVAERSPLRAMQSFEDPTVFLFTISTEMY
jgi:hypothetical protein